MNESEIQKKINATLKASEEINDVKISPFLKENILYQLSQQSQVSEPSNSTWFTPKLQWAAFVMVIAFNVFVISKWNSTQKEDRISSFSKAIGLESESDTNNFLEL